MAGTTFGLCDFDKGEFDALGFEELEFAVVALVQLEPEVLVLEKLVLGTLREVLLLVSLVLTELLGNLALWLASLKLEVFAPSEPKIREFTVDLITPWEEGSSVLLDRITPDPMLATDKLRLSPL